MNEVKVISARRAYEFRPDNLRLTSLTVREVVSMIQEEFDFRGVSITTPPPVFGEVAVTIPPGLVFNVGATRLSGGQTAPIRFLHFEPERIVVDVAAPTSAIDEIFGQLRKRLAEVKSPDGSLAIGELERVRDYSEVSAQLDVGFDQLLSTPLAVAAQRMFAPEEEAKTVPVTLVLHVGNSSSPVSKPDFGQAVIQIRAGTSPDEHIYFSSVDLPSDQNVEWLTTLEARIAQSSG